jgi:putative hemolysin
VHSPTYRETRVRPALYVELAGREADRLAPKRLRYTAFAQASGAQRQSADRGIDQDAFDEHCRHLLVRERDAGPVVATSCSGHPRVGPR